MKTDITYFETARKLDEAAKLFNCISDACEFLSYTYCMATDMDVEAKASAVFGVLHYTARKAFEDYNEYAASYSEKVMSGIALTQ